MTTLTAPRTVADLLAVAHATGEWDDSRVLGHKAGHWRLYFRNGWIISIGFGPTYSADYAHITLSLEETLASYFAPETTKVGDWVQSTTAEVMVIKPDGNRMTWPHNEDGILGFEPVESVAALIRMVAKEGAR